MDSPNGWPLVILFVITTRFRWLDRFQFKLSGCEFKGIWTCFISFYSS